MQKMSEAEMEVMKAIWTLGGEVTSGELQKALDKDWKPTTILTFLARLVEKGILTVKKGGKGKANIYTALVSENGYKNFETQSFLKSVHKGSVKNFIATLYEGNNISQNEINELKEWFSKK